MTCFRAKRHSTAYVDGRLRAGERSKIASHLHECEACSSYFDQVAFLRSNLQGLPAPASPILLKTQLRVLASRERSALWESRGSRLAEVWRRWKFRVDEFMRPLTLPATGGLLSSMALFATLALSIAQTASSVAYEVPLGYEDKLSANLVPVDMRTSVLLTMSLDNKGRILDYAVRDSAAAYTGNTAHLVYNNISLPSFPGVMTVARPISSAVSISLTPLVFEQ